MSRLIVFFLFFSACQSGDVRVVQLTELTYLPLDNGTSQADSSEVFLPSVDSGWVDVLQLDTTFALDIRYATTDNFVGIQMYPCARCLLRPEVARALVRIQNELYERGLGLKFYDCYRPWSVQNALWQKMPDARYVTPPEKGSMHNRGGAVDLTIIDKLGNELDMGTAYDFFGEEAYHTFTGHPKPVEENRQLLRSLMEAEGFRSIRTEWWHYSYQKKMYEIEDYQWACPDHLSNWQF